MLARRPDDEDDDDVNDEDGGGGDSGEEESEMRGFVSSRPFIVCFAFFLSEGCFGIPRRGV